MLEVIKINRKCFACVIDYDYTVCSVKQWGAMKQSEFVRWLKQQGATFEEGTNHTKVKLNGRTSFLPRHPAKELTTGVVEGVKKQLKLK